MVLLSIMALPTDFKLKYFPVLKMPLLRIKKVTVCLIRAGWPWNLAHIKPFGMCFPIVYQTRYHHSDLWNDINWTLNPEPWPPRRIFIHLTKIAKNIMLSGVENKGVVIDVIAFNYVIYHRFQAQVFFQCEKRPLLTIKKGMYAW